MKRALDLIAVVQSTSKVQLKKKQNSYQSTTLSKPIAVTENRSTLCCGQLGWFTVQCKYFPVCFLQESSTSQKIKNRDSPRRWVAMYLLYRHNYLKLCTQFLCHCDIVFRLFALFVCIV